MPRKKKYSQSSVVPQNENDISTLKLEQASVLLNGCNINESCLDLWEADLQIKFQEVLATLEMKTQSMLSTLDIGFSAFLLSVSETLLKTPIDLNDENLKDIFVNNSMDSDALKNDSELISTENCIKRRRSRSARDNQLAEYGTIKKVERKRSCSLDIYKTPLNRMGLSDLTSAKKYTVSKPRKVEESGISFKRIMKPHEEAISTSGSPLFVHPHIATAPTVNIPLPGGVVMNIEPKKPRGHITVPELDARTKEQLRILCQQLNTMF